MAAGRGEYTREVEAELRHRCVHLLTKEAFVGIPSEHEQAFPADEPIWWCDRTGESMGPDEAPACRRDCHGPGRSCYVAPVRL
jgi:hypothetical protein